ncbi:MAG: hypothetical protein IJY09_05545 [Lachnospiraceae bacterium]|nr:hypothetical protein [Lachnospiraceae bacterium]
MSEYRRWISYIYAYEGGAKKQNGGYARIEVRGNKVRFHIHMNLPAKEQTLKVCCYKLQGEQCDGVCLGDFSLVTGREEIRMETDANNLEGSGLFFVEMSGLLLVIGNPEEYLMGNYYASSWEEEPLSSEEAERIWRKIQGGRRTEPEEMPEENKVYLKESEELQSESEVYLSESEESQGKNEVDIQQAEPMEESMEEQIPDATIPKAVRNEPELAAQEEKQAELPNRNHCCSNRREDRPFCCLEQMYPFEDGEFERSVRMEPQDIGLLPRSMWKYAGNSFLLHGFYTYHHLLLTRKRGKDGDTCYLLIPGTYGTREQHMAQMFGFQHFKCLKRKALENGDFGYWYLEVPQ